MRRRPTRTSRSASRPPPSARRSSSALLYQGAPWGFYLLVLPATLIGAWELFDMTHPGDRRVAGDGRGHVGGRRRWPRTSADGDARILLTMIVAVPLAGPLLTLVRLGDMKTAALRACAHGLRPALRRRSRSRCSPSCGAISARTGRATSSSRIMFAWFGDTGGYFAGRFLGQAQALRGGLAEEDGRGRDRRPRGQRVRRGARALLVPAVAVARARHRRSPSSRARSVRPAISASRVLKRSIGVKDSGAIVPGHGGILDRVDALLVTSAVTFLYTIWFLPRLALSVVTHA